MCFNSIVTLITHWFVSKKNPQGNNQIIVIDLRLRESCLGTLKKTLDSVIL
jgi:hypothetical protein